MSVPQGLDNIESEREDLLWKMFSESRTHLRHYQSQRATVSNIILVTSMGVVGFIARKPLDFNDWPLTCGLVVIGLCGTAFMANYFECIDRSKKKADQYRARLNAMLGIQEESNTNGSPKGHEESPAGQDDGDDQGLPKLRSLRGAGRFRVLWPLAIALMGAIATGYILFFQWLAT